MAAGVGAGRCVGMLVVMFVIATTSVMVVVVVVFSASWACGRFGFAVDGDSGHSFW